MCFFPLGDLTDFCLFVNWLIYKDSLCEATNSLYDMSYHKTAVTPNHSRISDTCKICTTKFYHHNLGYLSLSKAKKDTNKYCVC